jgi:hypothetical protein
MDDPKPKKGYFKFTKKELDEREKERKRLYPEENPDFVRYVRYPCSYCGEKTFKVYPIRAEGLEPLRLLYMIRPKHSKKLVGICQSCLMEFKRRNESNFSSNLEG